MNLFTDRFIRVPIEAYSQKDADIMGEKRYFDSYEMFDPTDISSYFESISDDVRCTQLHLKSGHHFLVNLNIEKFEKLLNSWLVDSEEKTLNQTFSRK